MIKSDFHKILKEAINNDESLIVVIDKIMPIINKLSKINKKELDEDLKSILITYSIEIIRKKEIYKIF